MSRNYIFVIHSMSGIGGGQRYALSKARFLKENGWRVSICHVKDGDVLLDVAGIRLVDMPELRAHPRCIGRRRADKLFQAVLPDWQEGDEVYVESAAPYLGAWGEVIAERFNGIHLCYVLEETPRPEDIAFLRFKDGRHELAFISESIAVSTLGLDSSCRCDDKVLVAYNPSPIDDVPFETQSFNSDYVIGCISRLEKPFISHMMCGLADFCKNNPQLSISIVFIGDSAKPGYRERIESIAEDVTNLRVFVLGFLSPIPLALVESFDLCIAKAGAASSTSRIGIPTIRYSLDKDVLLGFDSWLNLGANDTPSNVMLGADDLPGLLSMVLLKGRLDEVKRITGFCSPSKNEYSKHFSFVPRDNSRVYFDCWHSHVGWQRCLSSCWVKVFRSASYDRLLDKLRTKRG